MASGNTHSVIVAGKLTGVMPTHTPSGWVML
ncbi:carboxyltransferase domain-containing protein [Pseudomonas aeruginosa]